MIDAMFAFDVFNGRMNDSSINSNIVRLHPPRGMLNVNVVAEPSFRTEYLSSQPVARLRRIMNVYANSIRFDTRSRFKLNVLNEIAANEED